MHGCLLCDGQHAGVRWRPWRFWTKRHRRRPRSVCRADQRFPLHSPAAKTDSGFMRVQTKEGRVKRAQTNTKLQAVGEYSLLSTHASLFITGRLYRFYKFTLRNHFNQFLSLLKLTRDSEALFKHYWGYMGNTSGVYNDENTCQDAATDSCSWMRYRLKLIFLKMEHFNLIYITDKTLLFLFGPNTVVTQCTEKWCNNNMA